MPVPMPRACRGNPRWRFRLAPGSGTLAALPARQPEAQVLMLRIFDLAPKGPDKSAQGIALEEYATPCGRSIFNQQPALKGRNSRTVPAMSFTVFKSSDGGRFCRD